MPKYCILLTLIILIEFNPVLANAQDFKASVIKVDITPDTPQYLAGYGARQSTGILDRIYHRIVVLDDGSKQFFLVSSDFGKIDPTLYNQVASILNEKFGIIREDFWWSVTHTHSAPEIGDPGLSAIFMPERYKQPIASDYTEFVVQKLVEGIEEAKGKLEPASLGVGWGYSQANINRRAINVDGRASLGLNPDGPVDRRIGLIRIDKKDGSPLVLISNYAIHGTVMGSQNLEISGDAPGIVSEYVEEKIGAPLLFINGAAGNLAPIYSVYPSAKAGHLGEFRVLLGDKILDANEKISFTTNKVKLEIGSVTVETPRKEGLDWPSSLISYSRSTVTGDNMVLIPISFLKINENVVIWSAPLELFCEISNEIRDRSPFPYTFYFGYTNGNLRYLVTESAYKHGGYEPNASPFTPSAASDLTESVVSYLQGEMRSKN